MEDSGSLEPVLFRVGLLVVDVLVPLLYVGRVVDAAEGLSNDEFTVLRPFVLEVKRAGDLVGDAGGFV